MNNKEEIMDYLYGEMNLEQRLKFEDKVSGDAALQEEIRSLEQTRLFLGKSEDQEPKVLPIRDSQSVWGFGRKWMAIAASLVFLLVAGRVLGLQLQVSKNQVVIGFGDQQPEKNQQEMQYAQILSSLQDLQQKVDQKADVALVRNMEAEGESSMSEGDLIRRFKETLSQENSNLSQEVSARVNLEQKAYVQEIVMDLIHYWDAQREEDLKLLNNGLENLAQAIQLNDPAQFVSVENL